MTKEQLRILLKEVSMKNSWGKNELTSLILEVASGLHGGDWND